MTMPLAFVALQAAPPQALVLAMALSYALSLAGMLLAWRAYRKRQREAAAKPAQEEGSGDNSSKCERPRP